MKSLPYILIFVVTMRGWFVIYTDQQQTIDTLRSGIPHLQRSYSPCSPEIPCYLEYDVNGNFTVIDCKIHTPEPLVFEASDIEWNYYF